MRIAAAVPVVVERGERFVAGRLIAGLPKSVDYFRGLPRNRREAGRRRAFAAFMTGAALFAAGWVTLQSDVAGASGGRRDVLAALSAALDSGVGGRASADARRNSDRSGRPRPSTTSARAPSRGDPGFAPSRLRAPVRRILLPRQRVHRERRNRGRGSDVRRALPRRAHRALFPARRIGQDRGRGVDERRALHRLARLFALSDHAGQRLHVPSRHRAKSAVLAGSDVA